MLGHRYFLTLVDDYSRYTWVIFLKAKDQTKQSVIQFLAYIENHFHTSLKYFRSDNGTEFLPLSDEFLSKGVVHQKSCAYTPQQNGVVERKHQHILNVARSIYFHSHVPLTMWNFCIAHVVHLINRLPTPLLSLKCPYEKLYNQPPSIIHLKVFGCLGYAVSTLPHTTKFDQRARKSVFLGFKDGTKGYILYDVQHHNIFLSRHVTFYETVFPFKPTSVSSQSNQNPISDPLALPFLDVPETSHQSSTTTDISAQPDGTSSATSAEPDISAQSYVPSPNTTSSDFMHSPRESSNSPLGNPPHHSPSFESTSIIEP